MPGYAESPTWSEKKINTVIFGIEYTEYERPKKDFKYVSPHYGLTDDLEYNGGDPHRFAESDKDSVAALVRHCLEEYPWYENAQLLVINCLDMLHACPIGPPWITALGLDDLGHPKHDILSARERGHIELVVNALVVKQPHMHRELNQLNRHALGRLNALRH